MLPAHLLVHACTYKTMTGTDRDGNAEYMEVELSGVRFGPVTYEARQSAAVETAADKLTLYIDPVRTQPAVIPEELAHVTWQGKDYTIRAVTPCYTRNTDAVHHWECALI